MRKDKTIAIDFDGTIAQDNKFGTGVLDVEPNANVSRTIKKLYDRYNIVVFTVRVNPIWNNADLQRQQIHEWLTAHEIPFDDITAQKPKAIAYIDDKAIRFTNWIDIENYYT